MPKRTNPKPPSTIQDCDLLKAGLVDKILALQHQLEIVTEDNFGSTAEYADWKKSVKISLSSMQRGIARLNLLKKEIVLKLKTRSEESGGESSKSKRAKVIRKAFHLIIDDVLNDCVPKFNSATAIASHYMFLSDMPNGNMPSAQEDDEGITDDESLGNR